MDYEEIIKNIMKSEPKIRFVTIINMKGKILHSQHREDVTSVLSKNESKKSIKQIRDFWKGNSDLIRKFGKAKFFVANYEKINRIVIPYHRDFLIYITIEEGIEHDKIIKRVLDVVDKL